MLPATKPVLCVLSDEQQRHYADGLGALRARGARMIVHTDPEKALASLESDNPLLVVVGNWVEDMEGLEFLARMLRRFPEYDGRIVVLPDEGDPFPPMVHHRPHPGARSEAVSTNFGEMAGWLDDPTGGTAPGESGGSTAGAGEETMPAGMAPSPRPGAGTERRTARVGGESRGLPLALKVALPLAIAAGAFGLVYFLHGPGSEKTTSVSGAGMTTAPAASTEGPPPSAPPEPPSPEGEAKLVAIENRGNDDRFAKPARDEPRPAKVAEFSQGGYVTLPLLFPKDEAPFSVGDPEKLKGILSALRAALRQDGRLKVELGGHTSVATSALGRTRAESVKPLLREAGIDNDRVIVRNYGSRMPVVRSRGDDARNRRVTARIIVGAR